MFPSSLLLLLLLLLRLHPGQPHLFRDRKRLRPYLELFLLPLPLTRLESPFISCPPSIADFGEPETQKRLERRGEWPPELLVLLMVRKLPSSRFCSGDGFTQSRRVVRFPLLVVVILLLLPPGKS